MPCLKHRAARCRSSSFARSSTLQSEFSADARCIKCHRRRARTRSGYIGKNSSKGLPPTITVIRHTAHDDGRIVIDLAPNAVSSVWVSASTEIVGLQRTEFEPTTHLEKACGTPTSGHGRQISSAFRRTIDANRYELIRTRVRKPMLGAASSWVWPPLQTKSQGSGSLPWWEDAKGSDIDGESRSPN